MTSTDCRNPGYYSLEVAADRYRKEFNIKNDALQASGKRPDFLFVGDSITQFWELGIYFSTDHRLFINRGIAGDTTTYLKKRFYADVLANNPVYCIMGIGINDTMELEGDFWKLIPPAPYDEVLTKSKENIAFMIKQAKAVSLPLILTSLLPFHAEIYLHEPIRQQYVLDLNAWLQKTAEDKGLIFVDYYSHFVQPDNNCPLEGATYDGLHPNDTGYRIMARVLKETLALHNILL